MNKEELYYQILTLQQENKQLKERINKAIEYIDNHISYECDGIISGRRFCSHHLYDFSKNDLLEILRGDSNENNRFIK